MFIAFPLQSRPDWHHPPWVTILLVLVNVAIFLGPQRTDERRAEAAHRYYMGSELPRIELPLFVADLDQRPGAEAAHMAAQVHEALEHQHGEAVAELLEQDPRFNERVTRDTLLPHADARWQTWHEQRQHYQTLRGERFTERWLLRDMLQRPETLLTSMFLHGSAMHLVGNMVFLFAFGYTVELALGSLLYLVFYLLSGLAGGLLYGWVHGASEIGSLGASGAISGLMAMYAVAYGFQRIKFFYQFLFYFDSVRAPAIILLPIWIATQLLQQMLDKHAGVAFMDHVGGLLGGALLMGLYRWRTGGKQLTLEAPPRPAPAAAPVDEDLLAAQDAMKNLRFAQARPLYAKLIDRYPQRESVLRAAHTLFKSEPAHSAYHHCVRHALALPQPDAQLLAWQGELLLEYLRQAMPRPRLNAAQLVQAGLNLARGGVVPAALAAEAAVTRLEPGQAQIPALRLALVSALLRAGQQPQAQAMAQRLEQAAPEAQEARLARQLLGA